MYRLFYRGEAFLAATILSLLVAAGFVMAVVSTFRKDPQQLEHVQTLGLPVVSLAILGTPELCEVVGLTAGLLRWPLSVAVLVVRILSV